MRTSLLLALLGVCLSPLCRAQQLTPSVMAAAGGYDKTSTVSLEWTVGESVVETAKLPERTYTQGFHQPALEVTTSKTLLADANYQIDVAPNPVEAILYVRIQTKEGAPVAEAGNGLLLNLMDQNGKLLQTREASLSDQSLQLNMANLPSGMYLLTIQKTPGTPIKSFKVLKN